MSTIVLPPDPASLAAALGAVRRALEAHGGKSPHKSYRLENILGAFQALKEPLNRARGAGGIINPWSIMGLKRDELRNAAAMAGLWQYAFAGTTSRRFLADYLASAITCVEWISELSLGYRIETECRPMGDGSDRIDLVVETTHHLVAIEVKIDAGLGPRQLERYKIAIDRRARLRGLSAHLVLLAPYPAPESIAHSTHWSDVAGAARRAPAAQDEWNMTEHLIARFGDHISDF